MNDFGEEVPQKGVPRKWPHICIACGQGEMGQDICSNAYLKTPQLYKGKFTGRSFKDLEITRRIFT